MKINILPFTKVVNDSTKKFTKVKKQDYLSFGKYIIIDQGKNFICGYTNNEQLINFDDSPVIIFGDHTKVFKYIDFPIAIGADGVKVLTVDSSIADIKYVYYYLKSLKLHDAGYSRHFKYLKAKKIALPEDKQNQIRIANLLTQVESLIGKREESIALLDELLKSTFLDMFGDPVLNPKGWKVKSLKKFGSISTGNTPPRKEDKYYDDEYIEWIKTDNIKIDKMYLTSAKEYLSEVGLEKGRSVNKGSLLVTCIAGSLKSIGNASLTDRKVSFNQQINAIEPFDDVNSFFLYWLIKISKKYIQDQAGKGMKKMITKSSFEKITFPKPDKTLQDKFATIAQQVEVTKAHYQDSLNELNELFGSLSQRAFRGELDLSGMVSVHIPVIKALDDPSSSGARDIDIERQEVKYIEGDAKSGAGELEEILDVPIFIRKQIADAREIAKSIDTEQVKVIANEVKELQKSFNMGDTIKQMNEAVKLFKDIKIPSIKIDIPPLYAKVPSVNMESINIFKTSQQIMESLKKREEHIYKMLDNIPQIKEAIERDILCKDDFLEVALRYDYEYAEIKRIIMDKLASNKLAQHFDGESKSIKLVKAT